MLHIQQKLKSFKPISLTQMDGVALMERVDEKYTVSINDITDILEKTIGQYYCLNKVYQCKLQMLY